jgi:hypothetical protein
MKMLRGSIAFALAAVLAMSSAQAQEVAGTWAVNFDKTIKRDADGRDSVAVRGRAQLVIEVKNDSAFGIWTLEGPGGQPLKLRGTWKGNSVKLVSDVLTGQSITRAGTTTVTYVSTYEATVTADVIAGTTTSQQKGQLAVGARARKFEGKREKPASAPAQARTAADI